MALNVGDMMPNWAMPGSDGKEWGSLALRGQAYVLTFYPADETPGCVAQVCALRDVWEDFRGKDVLVFGVSRDSIDSHKAFVEKRELPYVLLTDATGHVHKALDIGRNIFGGANRVSYLVDKEGRIAAVYESNMHPSTHAERMVEAVARLR